MSRRNSWPNCAFISPAVNSDDVREAIAALVALPTACISVVTPPYRAHLPSARNSVDRSTHDGRGVGVTSCDGVRAERWSGLRPADQLSCYCAIATGPIPGAGRRVRDTVSHFVAASKPRLPTLNRVLSCSGERTHTFRSLPRTQRSLRSSTGQQQQHQQQQQRVPRLAIIHSHPMWLGLGHTHATSLILIALLLLLSCLCGVDEDSSFSAVRASGTTTAGSSSNSSVRGVDDGPWHRAAVRANPDAAPMTTTTTTTSKRIETTTTATTTVMAHSTIVDRGTLSDGRPSSPDINYYQHNANDDEDDDDDGYQDPTSLLEQSRYDADGGGRLNGDDSGYQHQQYAAHQANQQQTLTQTQIEFLKSMVGFRKKWTPYELRTCNEIRLIIGSREYDSLRKNDGMPLPSVKTLRKYRNTEQTPVDPPEEVDLVGRKRKHHEILAEEGGGVGGGPAGGGQHKVAEAYGEGRLFPYGNAATKVMKAEQDSEDGHFDVGVLTKAQISFLKTLSLNTKGFSDYELQRSLELKNELGSKNYETLRKQEFLNIPTLVMLTRYEQDNGLEDLSRMAGAAIAVDDDEHDGRGGDGGSVELVDNDVRHTAEEEDRLEQRRQQQQLEEEQAREEQEQQQQLELYNRLTQADLTRHPLFDTIAGDTSPVDGADPTATAAAIAAAMAAAAVSMHQSLDLNGGTGDDSSLGIFENHSIFDKDSPTFDMSKLSPAHVEFLNTLPENPKRWTQEMINSALDIKNEIGTRDYEILRRQGIPLPAARTLRRHKDIRNKADRAMSEPGEILPGTGATAGIVGSG
uniref:Uncharacterized protein n=1 Tax=Anopheles atroparvus TaxID=41427 RepID=A0A182JKM1_ANOAO